METNYKLFDPKNDFAFKSMFTFDDKSKKALIIFLNAVIQPKEGKKITDITYVNTYVNIEYPDEKKSIMDIKVAMQDGESINIEMQVNDDDAYVDRTTYYAATLITEQPLKGKSYDELKRCVVINLVATKIVHFITNFWKVIGTFQRLVVKQTISVATSLK